MLTNYPSLAVLFLVLITRVAVVAQVPSFLKIQITDHFWAEGAALDDIDRDGEVDVVSGPFWYQGPGFKVRHEIWPATARFTRARADGTVETFPGFEGALGIKNAYSDNFLTFTCDINGDGWTDVLVIDFPGKAASWFENPRGADIPWSRHLVHESVGNESPGLVDVTGDGKPELTCCSHGRLGYLECDWNNPVVPWSFHAVSPAAPPLPNAFNQFTHGLGAGDLNGDGRVDLIEKDAWWEQSTPGGAPAWVRHAFPFAEAGAQMLVYDVNGDGLPDVITSLHAHRYGLAWYEQVRHAGDISFRQHLILNPTATPNADGVSFTQPHSLALADIDGDGLMDIVTGKRFWAHGKSGPDPESDGRPAVLYWFQLQRGDASDVSYVAHLIDEDSGVGTQVTVAPSHSSRPVIAVGNKKGLFVFVGRVNLAPNKP
ncbi:MAG: VCBS repeat-containing protein [Opitutus sp.]